jgi:polyhydroxyalkanoate synthesis regulator phasin
MEKQDLISDVMGEIKKTHDNYKQQFERCLKDIAQAKQKTQAYETQLEQLRGAIFALEQLSIATNKAKPEKKEE